MTGAGRPAISARGLSKIFEVHGSPAGFAAEFLTGRKRHQEFAALRDVSFDVMHGEVVGVVGRNGAGKSTLLKIVTGALPPSSGEVSVDGRLSAILELGLGFHPDYSGRENVLMGGMCLGLKPAEIRDRLGWVIEFSELARVIDQPLRTYSTGMQARLAFATAMCLRPDILIVDEALSVGDARFQRKCFAQFERLRAEGKTIIFVSHNHQAIIEMCDRCIYLDGGRVKRFGPSKEVVEEYLRDHLGGKAGEDGEETDAGLEKRYGDRRVEIERVTLEDEQGGRLDALGLQVPFRVRVGVRCHAEQCDDLQIGLTLRTVEGITLFACNTVSQQLDLPAMARGESFELEFALRNCLAPGVYFLTVGAWGYDAQAHYDRRVDVLQLEVIGNAGVLRESRLDMAVRCTVRPASRQHPELR